MTKKSRNILIIVGIFVLGITGLIGYGIYSAYSFYSKIESQLNKPIPPKIKEPKVFKGKDFLTKKEFFKLTTDGFITTISDGIQIKDNEKREQKIKSNVSKGIYGFEDLQFFHNEIIAVGEFGGYVFDLNGNLIREITFDLVKEKIKIGWYEQDSYDRGVDNLRIVKFDKDHYGFISHGSRQGVRVFDEKGKQIWSYGKEDDPNLEDILKSNEEIDKEIDKGKYVLEATVGDLDNDGIAEYIVASKNIGIQAFNKKGEKLWLQKDEFPSDKLLVTDIDYDGKNELLEIGSKIRSGDGILIKAVTAGSSGDAVLFAENEKQEKVLQFCDFLSEKLVCEDFEENKILEAEAPLSSIKLEKPVKLELPVDGGFTHTIENESIAYPRAVWVKLKEKEPKYLAIVGAFIGLPRANFYLYTPDGNLVYHELLNEDAETIAVIPKDNELEEILIGGKDTIWKFSAK